MLENPVWHHLQLPAHYLVIANAMLSSCPNWFFSKLSLCRIWISLINNIIIASSWENLRDRVHLQMLYVESEINLGATNEGPRREGEED